MPEISSPTISSPTTSGINKQQTPNKSNSTSNNNSSNTKSNSNSNSNTKNTSTTSQSLNLSAASLLQLSNSSSSLSSLGNLNSLLSGSGINSLSNTNNSSTLILNQILEQLNNIQSELSDIKNSTDYTQNKNSQNTTTNNNISNSLNNILKFKINGINILPSITNVFFSKQENDGSLLVSFDRTYFINSQKFDETLYLFFRNVGNNIYEVALSLSQIPLNENSLFYKLKNYSVYESTKSSNCYLINFSRKDLSIELLLQS